MRSRKVKRTSIATTATSLILAILTQGCNESKFRASQDKPIPASHTVNFNGIDDLDAGERRVARIDSIDFTIQAAAERILQSTDAENFPVDLYFLVDTTNSMTPSINAVRDSIVALAEDLKNRGMDLNAGFIGFIDTEVQARDLDLIRPLTADIQGLQNYVSSVQVAQPNSNQANHAVNGDHPEASLWAIDYAISQLASGDGRPNAAKILLLITDVVGHDGLTGIADSQNHSRNCDVDNIRSTMNSYAASLASPDLFRFYYVVPNPANQSLTSRERQNATALCNVAGIGPANAKQQMEHLMIGLVPNVTDPAKRSGALLNQQGDLAWPLKNHDLAEMVAAAVQTTKPVAERVLCEARGITVKSDGEMIYSWESTHNDLLQTNSIRLDEVIAGARQTGEQSLTFTVDRCCVEINDETNQVDDREHCVQRFDQTIQYLVINR